MSSGFVSGGTADAPIARDAEWLAAQQEIEATRRKREEASRQNNGRSLFETLEANKAAKQEAFEEANKLKNQFRSLDADEIDFLDSVLEKTRADEDRVKKETAEGLEAFRRQQEEIEKARREGDSVVSEQPADEAEWTSGTGRKRKRVKEKEVLKRVKLRKSSSTIDAQVEPPLKVGRIGSSDEDSTTKSASSAKVVHPVRSDLHTTREQVPPTTTDVESSHAPSTASSLSKPATGLVAYGSDSEDD